MEIKIQEYYLEHKYKLHNLFKFMEEQIEGRICHSSIIILKILMELDKDNIKNYLEIGVHNGGSMSLVLCSDNIENLYGIDLFEDVYDESKHFNSEKYEKYKYFKRDNLSFLKTMNNLNKIQLMFNPKTTIKLIQGNSYFDETEEKFREEKRYDLDLLFIDGDHTPDGVRNDFERYSKYVRKGGYVIFDDYHHKDIKNYCDSMLNNNQNWELLCKFKSDNSKAIDLLIQRSN